MSLAAEESSLDAAIRSLAAARSWLAAVNAVWLLPMLSGRSAKSPLNAAKSSLANIKSFLDAA